MQRWQYGRLHVSTRRFDVLITTDDSKKGDTFSMMNDAKIAELGEEGWEMVSADEASFGSSDHCRARDNPSYPQQSKTTTSTTTDRKIRSTPTFSSESATAFRKKGACVMLHGPQTGGWATPDQTQCARSASRY
jgi:hypothetical protein